MNNRDAVPFLPHNSGDLPFWHPDSSFQRSGHWLRHSYAVDRLSRPDGSNRAAGDYRATCGPAAFAAATAMGVDDALPYFPAVELQSFTTRLDMQRALAEAGHRYTREAELWPVSGLCLLQLTGAWMRGEAALKHAHWIAVLGEYVFDIKWNGWLPRDNWEDVVLNGLLESRPGASGWRIEVGYELSMHSSRFA